MSIYASIPGLGDFDDDEEVGAPFLYRGSHILPANSDPRGGSVGLALIPSHITRDGRDDQPEDGTPWPWLRLNLDVPHDDPCVLLNPRQARHLAGLLTAWAGQVEPPSPTATKATQPATWTQHADGTWTHPIDGGVIATSRDTTPQERQAFAAQLGVHSEEQP